MLGFRPPEFSCLPVAGSPYRMASTVHQTWGNFLSRGVGCLPARPLASALRRLAPLYREILLLRQIPPRFPAGPRIYTGLSCSACALVCLSILPLCPGSVLFPRSRDPGPAPKCFAQCPNPWVGRKEASKTMQLAKKGKFITDLSQGSCCTSNTVVQGQRALSRGGYPNS